MDLLETWGKPAAVVLSTGLASLEGVLFITSSLCLQLTHPLY